MLDYIVPILISVFVTLLLLFGVYLFCIAPNKRKNISFPYKDVYIAHRGFFDNKGDCPENSLAAFKKAVEHGYGIELDVQMSKDEKLVVFHDDGLKRMCNVDKNVRDFTYEELRQFNLLSSKQTIPLFCDVLEAIDGRVPLIVEIKSDGDWKTTTYKTLEMLKDYDGEFCIESFHPSVIEIVRKERPDIVRGQLATDFFKDEPKRKWIHKFLLSNLLTNVVSRPDFVAYNHKHVSQPSYKFLRASFGVINVAWTIRSQEELEQAKKVFDCIIFDSFTPDEKKTDGENS